MTADPNRLPTVGTQGERVADDLVASTYQELHRIAKHHMRRERSGQTLQTTALVNEAYLRLIDLRQIERTDRKRFFVVAAGIMRRILVDRARARNASKRGGDDIRVTLDDAIADVDNGLDLLALDRALQRLASGDELQARIVELRFFAGLSVTETAAALAQSPATVKRKWALAKAWLYRELNAVS